MRTYYRFLFALLVSLVLTGCQQLTFPTLTDPSPERVPEQAPDWVRATGYAPISLQPGETAEHKQLNAMRVSKLRAYQELAAIINGQYLYGTTTIESMVLQNDGFKSAVAGIVRGARVVKSYPIQADTYATILEVDLNKVEQAWISTD